MMRPVPVSPITPFCDAHGILLRRDAVLKGIDDNALARLVEQGLLVRMRQGAYCLRDVYLSATEGERHRLLCRAVMQQYAEHVALSHASSCLAQGGPEWGIDLGNAHVTHLSGGGRKGGRVVHHHGECRVGDLRRQDGHWLTVPTRAILEVACTDGAAAALVQANHFLHRDLTTLGELQAMAGSTERWPGSLVHHPVLHLADPRIESVGESRCCLLFWSEGLARPEVQFEVTHPSGIVAARVDFAWPALKVIVEFDGQEKYHRYRRPGESLEQMVAREKKREDLIRELTGWTVIRITWADLAHPHHVAARIRRAAARSVA